MEFGFEGFDSVGLDVELEDIEVKRTKKFDRVWKWSSGGSVLGNIIHEGIIYMTSTDSHLYAIDSINGKILWKFKSGDVIWSQAAVFKNIVSFGSYDGYIYTLNRLTGKELWRFKSGDKISAGGPTITQDSIYFGSKDGYVYCVGHDGKLKWRFRTSDEIACKIDFYKGKIYFGGFDFNLYCLDAENGREIWRFKTGGEVIYDSPTTIQNGRVYFGSLDNNVYCLDAETGRELWRTRIGKYGITCHVAEMNGKFYIGTREGNMFCLDADGKELWRFVTGGMIIRFSCRDGKIYFPSEDGNLYVVSEEGKELWRFRFGGPGSFDQPSFRENMVFIGSMDCHLYAIDENTREEIWRVRTSSSAPSTAPPPHEEFSMELKKSTHVEDALSGSKYAPNKKGETVSFASYNFESEYSTTSEYRQKSEYGAELVILDEILQFDTDIAQLNFMDNRTRA